MMAETLNDIAEYYDIPIIGVPAASLGISATTDQYKLVTRVSFTYTAVANALWRFFKAENYTTPVFIIDSSMTVYSQMGQLTQLLLPRVDFNLFSTTQFVSLPHSSNTTNHEIEDLLITANKRTRGGVTDFLCFDNKNNIGCLY